MIPRLLLSFLVVSTGVPGSWQEIWQTGCGSAPGVELLVASPDARAVVYRRKVISGDGVRRDLVFRNLVTGEETRHSILVGTETQAAISADGELVAFLNKDGNHTPSDLAIWRPATDEWKTWSSFRLRDTEEVTEEISGHDVARPAISPNAGIVAFFADLSSIRVVRGTPEQSESEVIALVSLATGKVSSIFPLPAVMKPELTTDWNLLWSADGRTVYAVLHKPYKIIENVKGPDGQITHRTNEPPLELYKCVLGETSCTALGSIPGRVYGIDSHDNLIFANRPSTVGERPRSFVRARVEAASQVARATAVLTAEAGTVAAVGTDLLGNDGAVTNIAFGSSRTYAVINARDKNGKSCQRLLESLRASSP